LGGVGRDGGQLTTASKRFGQLKGETEDDPDQVPWILDLRAIAEAADAVAAAEGHLRETVEVARARGRSWRQIGLVLGMSRQVARDRFGQESRAKHKASRARRVMHQEAAVLDRLALNQSRNGIVKHLPDASTAERNQGKKVRRPH
jgi:hypothetical protein